jgi:hypothetical protein
MTAALATVLLIRVAFGITSGLGGSPADDDSLASVAPVGAADDDSRSDEEGAPGPLLAAPVQIVRTFTAARTEIVRIRGEAAGELVAAPAQIVRLRNEATAPGAQAQAQTDR